MQGLPYAPDDAIEPEVVVEPAQRLGEFAMVFAVTYLLGRLVVVPTVSYLVGRRDVNETLEQAIDRVLRAGNVVGALAGAALAAGFGNLLGGSAVVVAALTLAVGFAAQDIIGNLVSGVFLVQDSKFNVGDHVGWEGNQGTIREITFRLTRVRTPDGTLVSVPNTTFTTGAVTNHSAGSRKRLTATFAVGHDTDLEVAQTILLEEAESHTSVLDEPDPPTARVTEVGDPQVTLEVLFWHPRRLPQPDIRSSYVRRVKTRFDELGIDFSPSSGQHLTGSLALRAADDEE